MLAAGGVARAYTVGPPLDLEKLTEEADVIFKGTAIGGAQVEDGWFTPYPGFVPIETRLKVVSTIKGAGVGEFVRFRHYDRGPAPQGFMYAPQSYHFEEGRTYIVFAKKTDDAAILRQRSASHTARADLGVLSCRDTASVEGRTVKEIFWNELMAMLQSPDAGDVTYAIGQADAMSGRAGSFPGTNDFERADVLSAIHGLMRNADAKVAQAAIAVVGSGNPYLTDERAEYWLATVGGAEIPGIGKMDPKMINRGAELYWKDLAAVAEEKIAPETRALAIRALGLLREPALREFIVHWLADSEPSLRVAATLLLADFPGSDADRRLTGLAGDPAPEVRIAVAHSIGFAQRLTLSGSLGKLLLDPEPKVRRAAAMCLLSFSPKENPIAKIFRSNLDNAEFKPLFLNALAVDDPKPYLAALTRAVVERPEPRNGWGGQVPAYTSWLILYRHLRAQPVADVRSGKLDRYLDALEHGYTTGSAEPMFIYAFYLQCGLTERARRYRETATKAVSYDMWELFDNVEKNPANYYR